MNNLHERSRAYRDLITHFNVLNRFETFNLIFHSTRKPHILTLAEQQTDNFLLFNKREKILFPVLIM